MLKTLGVVALIIGIGVIGVFVWGVMASLPDIERYRRMRKM